MLFSGDPKYLNLLTFSIKQKREYFEQHKQLVNGQEVCLCSKCGRPMELSECEADHIIPWSKGGKTDWENLQFLCKKCNSEKSNR